MSTEHVEQVEHVDVIPNPSESSFDKTSSQWSVSTKSNVEKGGVCSVIKDDSSKQATKSCFPIVQLFQSLFKMKKSPPFVDNKSLLDDLKENTDLIVDFFEGSVIPKLKIYAEEVHFPKMHSFGNVELFQSNGKLSLPTAQVWTATYFLNLCSQIQQESHSISNESEKSNTKPEQLINTDIPDVIKSNSLRRSFLLLYWEMEVTKRIVQDFHNRFVKFANDMNGTFKKLRTILLTSSSAKSVLTTQLSLFAATNDADFNVKKNLEINFRKEKGSILVLELKPSLNRYFPCSLSIDTTNCDGRTLTKNQDCSRVSKNVQEEIVLSLLKSATESLANCRCLLECNVKRISSKGIIKKGVNGSKDVTCYSALNSVKQLATELVSRKRGSSKLEESERNQLFRTVSYLYEKWNEFVGCSQWVILKFYELNDMITVCYWFTLQHIKMSIPEPEIVQKEVNIKLRNQKNNKSRSRQDKLKHYAIGTLIEECNGKSSTVSTTSFLKKQMDANFYQQSMISTRYHLAIRECPLEIENTCGKYTIRLRPIPDLERMDSDMIMLDRDFEIKMKKSEESDLLKTNLSANFQHTSFKFDSMEK